MTITETPSDIAARLRNFIKAEFNIGDADPDFNDDVHLFDYGYIDSFGAVTLTTHIEQAYRVKITESDLIAHPLNTIAQIARFIVRRSKGEI